ncbi:hypothetical protein GCM10027074_01210 [Streptomyces deserti]
MVTWRRAQMVLLSAQGLPVGKIAEATFTSADRVRDVIHNFNADGFDSLCPQYRGGRPKTFTLPERREINKIAKSRPAEHGLPLLNLQPHPGRQWAERGGWHKDPDREPRPRRRATYTRPHGVRHLFVPWTGPPQPLSARGPPRIVVDNFSPHLTTRRDTRVGD